MTISPSWAGFLKGLLLAVLASVALYLSNSANLTTLSPWIAALVMALASSLESFLKAQSGNTTALFGAVNVTPR